MECESMTVCVQSAENQRYQRGKREMTAKAKIFFLQAARRSTMHVDFQAVPRGASFFGEYNAKLGCVSFCRSSFNFSLCLFCLSQMSSGHLLLSLSLSVSNSHFFSINIIFTFLPVVLCPLFSPTSCKAGSSFWESELHS